MSTKEDEQTETEQTETTSPMLDMSQADVKKMVAKAKAKGYITYDELNRVLPSDQFSSEQIEDVMSLLSEMGVNVVEDEGEGEEEPQQAAEQAEDTESREVVTTAPTTTEVDRTDDPVRMYLREMGTVELLSREGEIAIAKRIEAGRATMIGGLCESPLTFQAITIWRQELLDEKVLLRDVIDLETTFGQSTEDDVMAAVTPGEPVAAASGNGAAKGAGNGAGNGATGQTGLATGPPSRRRPRRAPPGRRRAPMARIARRATRRLPRRSTRPTTRRTTPRPTCRWRRWRRR